MHRKQHTAVFYPALISLGLILGDPHSHQSADQAAYCSTNAQTSERTHDRTGRNEWPDTGDRQGADPCQKTQCPTYNAPSRDARGSTFRRLSALLVSELPRTLDIGKQHRDVVVGKT